MSPPQWRKWEPDLRIGVHFRGALLRDRSGFFRALVFRHFRAPLLSMLFFSARLATRMVHALERQLAERHATPRQFWRRQKI